MIVSIHQIFLKVKFLHMTMKSQLLVIILRRVNQIVELSVIQVVEPRVPSIMEYDINILE